MRVEGPVRQQVGGSPGARVRELSHGSGPSAVQRVSVSVFLDSSRLPGKVCSPLGTLCPQL